MFPNSFSLDQSILSGQAKIFVNTIPTNPHIKNVLSVHRQTCRSVLMAITACLPWPAGCLLKAPEKMNNSPLMHSGMAITTTTTILQLSGLSMDNLGEPVPEGTFTHSHLLWSSIIPYLLAPSFTIHSRLLVQFPCLTVLFHNICPSLIWSTSGLEPSTSYSIHFFTQLDLFTAHVDTIATCFAAALKLCNLILVSLSTLYFEQLKKCMEYEVEGARPRGRAKKTWTGIVEKDCQACKLKTEDAMDRNRWRKQIRDD